MSARHLNIMQRSQTNHSANSTAKKDKPKSKLTNKDLDGFLPSPPPEVKKISKKSTMSSYRERLMRSKKLKKTSELVCISSSRLQSPVG